MSGLAPGVICGRTPAAAHPDLEIRRVSKRYGDTDNGHLAVAGLSFEVARGSFFSILGPSGCGKTTLLRLIAGFIAPDEGAILIAGQDMATVAPNRRPVNMVFQHLALFPMMNVADNVGYGLARRGLKASAIKAQVEAMLARVGLAGAGAKHPDQLSGGQKQRVAIARALVLEPALLLLDEPLGALDLKLREHMKIELKQLQADFGTTFVYITHDQSEALVLSDHVAVMHAGRFEQVGTPQQLYYQPATAFVAGFVGANNALSGRVAHAHGGLLEVVTPQGLLLHAHPGAAHLPPGEAATVFVRPEAMTLQRVAGSGGSSSNPTAAAASTTSAGPPNLLHGQVASLLFDGANSAVLIRVQCPAPGGHAPVEIRVALPQTGQFADLQVGEPVACRFDAERAVAFKTAPRVPP
jgi:spermidine/putrescine transport system ATP-binding protein